MDNSFLRLKSNIEEAFSLDNSPVIDLTYVGQVHLKPRESYLQISNSETPIQLSSYKVDIVDYCNNVIHDVTDQVVIDSFFDSNGIRQIVWEYYNIYDLGTIPVSLRFTEETNGDTFWTNLFISTNHVISVKVIVFA